MDSGKTTLYRHFDGADCLLYVGISRDPFRRAGAHAHGSRWADQIARVTMEQFETRAVALTAERLAIINEGPKFNVAHAGERASSMTSKEYRGVLVKLDLTQGEAAEFLNVSIRTSNGYANGEPIPEATAKLLRLMVRLDLSPKDVK